MPIEVVVKVLIEVLTLDDIGIEVSGQSIVVVLSVKLQNAVVCVRARNKQSTYVKSLRVVGTAPSYMSV